MSIHIIKGRSGEHLAAEYLQSAGYKILYCNWKYRRFEIDIIASRNCTLHIVEVKTRHSNSFGLPEQSVSKKKFRNLQIAAEHFLTIYPYWKRLQFDILSISRSILGDKYLWIEDVYL
jgi:putative endonuclease